MADKRVFRKITCACGREIGKNAIKRHRSRCPDYWRQRCMRAERKSAQARTAAVDAVVMPSAPLGIAASDEEE